MEYTDFSEIMMEITGGQNPITSIKEVAFVMGRDEQTVYGYRRGTTQPNWDDGCRLSCFLIEKHDYYRLGMQALLVCMGGKANGRVDDDLMAIIELVPIIRKAFKDRDKSGYINVIARLKAEVKDLEAEGDKL